MFLLSYRMFHIHTVSCVSTHSFKMRKYTFHVRLFTRNPAEISEEYSKTQPLEEESKQGFVSHDPTTDRCRSVVKQENKLLGIETK